MSILDLLTIIGTIASGLVSLLVLGGAAIDAVTRGLVRSTVRKWLGIEALREDHHVTQTYLLDLGSAHNDLAQTVADEHDIPQSERPHRVTPGYYERLIDDDDDLSRGDFLRGGGGD